MKANPIPALREKILRLRAQDLKIASSQAHPNVWGLLMETGLAQGAVTLLTVADGTSSLYLPNGSGIIGAGEHLPVRAAGEALLKTAEYALKEFSATEDFPLPEKGAVRFLALTHAGVKAAEGEEKALAQGTGALSALFFAGQSLLTQVRIVGQGRKA